MVESERGIGVTHFGGELEVRGERTKKESEGIRAQREVFES